jgi:hypothetical protein
VGTLWLILVPAALLVGAGWVWLRLRQGPDGAGRPWAGPPPLAIAAGAAFLLLGVFVAPRLLGFTFLFLPLVFRRGFGRGRGRGGPTR